MVLASTQSRTVSSETELDRMHLVDLPQLVSKDADSIEIASMPLLVEATSA
jgi:hypothetical protein